MRPTARELCPLGKPTYRAAVTSLFTGIGIGSGWTKNNISLKKEWSSYREQKRLAKLAGKK